MVFAPPGTRIESETGQAYFRFHSALAVLGIAGLAWLARPSFVSAGDLGCVAIYLAYAALWIQLVERKSGLDAIRQRTALFIDHVIFCTCLAFSGRCFALLAWVSVTTSVGHGLRFGQRRGIAAAFVGAVSIFCAVTLGPAWHLPVELALGMASTAVIAPIYVVQLVRTIELQRRQTEARAAALETEVRLDGLTGVLNRKGFDDVCRELTDASGQSTAPIGLVYLDLDGFKAVNDTYGHQAGDATLRQVAQLLTTAVRSSDSVARMGGDEFAILVRNPACEADVEHVATKATDAVRGWDWSAVGGNLGVSAGAVLLAPGESLANAVADADERMLQAKRELKRGRRSIG